MKIRSWENANLDNISVIELVFQSDDFSHEPQGTEFEESVPGFDEDKDSSQ